MCCCGVSGPQELRVSSQKLRNLPGRSAGCATRVITGPEPTRTASNITARLSSCQEMRHARVCSGVHTCPRSPRRRDPSQVPEAQPPAASSRPRAVAAGDLRGCACLQSAAPCSTPRWSLQLTTRHRTTRPPARSLVHLRARAARCGVPRRWSECGPRAQLSGR